MSDSETVKAHLDMMEVTGCSGSLFRCPACSRYLPMTSGVFPEHRQADSSMCTGSGQVPWYTAREAIPKGTPVQIVDGSNVIPATLVTGHDEDGHPLDERGDIISPTSTFKVDTFATGAVRESGKEERFDLIPPEPIRLLAIHYGRGAKKYAERNWEKGIPFSNMYNSLMRHLQAWQKGEEVDADTGSLHLVSALWNIVGLIEFKTTHPEMDDRQGSDLR